MADVPILSPVRVNDEAAGKRRRLRRELFGSDDPDVLGFFALSARGYVELDVLTLLETLVSTPLNVGVVNENILALLTRDEAEALLGVEELHGTCCQLLLFSIGEQARLAVSSLTSVLQILPNCRAAANLLDRMGAWRARRRTPNMPDTRIWSRRTSFKNPFGTSAKILSLGIVPHRSLHRIALVHIPHSKDARLESAPLFRWITRFVGDLAGQVTPVRPAADRTGVRVHLVGSGIRGPSAHLAPRRHAHSN